MPTREYRCEKCKSQFQVNQKASEATIQWCRCGGKLTVLLFPVAGRVRGGTPKFHR